MSRGISHRSAGLWYTQTASAGRDDWIVRAMPCSALASAFASGDATVVQREAHTIKGLLATFSDDQGAAEALELEKKAKLGELDGLGDAVGVLQGRLREVAMALRAG